MELKVGDKVRVKRYDVRPGYWNPDGEMDKYMGKVVTISCVHGGDVHIEEARGENGTDVGWYFEPQDFEPIRFKIGDRVVGNDKASIYSITTTGVTCDVVGVPNETVIEVRVAGATTTFTVRSECFDLVENEKLFEIYSEGKNVIVYDVKHDKKYERLAGKNNEFAVALELLNRANEESATYNAKVVCIESRSSWWTKGRIYDVDGGYIVDDEGDHSHQLKSLDDLNEYASAEFIEIVD